jgi:hypothetical protein
MDWELATALKARVIEYFSLQLRRAYLHVAQKGALLRDTKDDGCIEVLKLVQNLDGFVKQNRIVAVNGKR